MKQNTGDQRCLAFVAAAATDTPVEDFENSISHPPPYTEMEFFKYLADKGYFCGLGFSGEMFYKDIDVTDSLSTTKPEIIKTLKYGDLTKDTVLELTIRLGNFQALFTVQNEFTAQYHAIYWDGERVYDPSPMTGSNKKLRDYNIIAFFPIIKG